jgi:hypothetical protein
MSVGRPANINIENKNDYGFSPKKKSAAHHMMFDNTQAPWGTVASPTAVPNAKRSLERPGQGQGGGDRYRRNTAPNRAFFPPENAWPQARRGSDDAMDARAM